MSMEALLHRGEVATAPTADRGSCWAMTQPLLDASAATSTSSATAFSFLRTCYVGNRGHGAGKEGTAWLCLCLLPSVPGPCRTVHRNPGTRPGQCHIMTLRR